MNIELFNKELAIKVAKATNLEKHRDYKNAIDAWVEVSEMSLKYSKSRGIDSTYRNMLIKRTETILEHIKLLKLKLTPPDVILEEPKFNEGIPENQDLVDISQERGNIPDFREDNMDQTDDIENKSGAIVEINASKDFKIITPHEELDMDIFKDNKTVVLTDDKNSTNKQTSEKHEINKNLICFACGYDANPPNAKSCKNCGVEFK